MTMTIPPEPTASRRHRRRPSDLSRSSACPGGMCQGHRYPRAPAGSSLLVALSTAAMMLAPILAPTSFDQTYTSYLGVAALAEVDPPACGGDPDVHQ